MARVNVRTARKVYECGNCGDTISPGDQYRWAKPRYGAKVVRCMKTTCQIRPSMLTGSDKLANLYATQEALEDLVPGNYDTKEDLAVDVEGFAEQAREVASEYEESANNFDGGGLAEQLEDKAQEVESWADDIANAADLIKSIDGDEWHDEAQDLITEAAANQPL